MQQQNQEMQGGGGGGGGGEYFQYQFQNRFPERVMTDEQIEELRKQIVVYRAITEQLAEMYRAMSPHQELTGISSGNLYTDPIVASVPLGHHKISARLRWTPTALQLQILEGIYEQQNGIPPSKQKIKYITSELALYGPISETNVYNWFQNRRARTKRRQQQQNEAAAPQEAAVAECSATKEKIIITKPATQKFINNSEQEMMMPKPATLEFIDNSTQGVDLSFCSFQNSDAIGIEQLIGKVESSQGYGPYMEPFD